jgi:protein-disulfide isomerase
MAAMRPSVKGPASRRNMLLAIGVGVAGAVVIIVVAAVFRAQGDAPEVVPNPTVNLTGIPEDDAVLGKPAAKVTLIEYADQQCPGCRYYTLNIFPELVNEYVRTGKVKMEYRGFPFIGSDSVKALRFLLAAGLQNRLWQLQETFYRHQGRENSGWVTDDLTRQLVATIPGLDVKKLFRDAGSDAITREAEDAEPAASAAGVPGTPTFFIQVGKAQPYYVRIQLDATQFRAALDDALKG